MKRLFNILLFVGVIAAVIGVLFFHDDIVAGLPSNCQPTQVPADYEECQKDTTGKCYTNCTDPNRPSYDLWGNEWDYIGNLIHATCPNVADPISKQDNPECVCPAATSEGVYYIQGYDKDTNKVVCGFSYYHACPYADAMSADDPQCQELSPQAQAQAQQQAQEQAQQPDSVGGSS